MVEYILEDVEVEKMTIEQVNDFEEITCLMKTVHRYCEEKNCTKEDIPLSKALEITKDELSNLEAQHIKGEPWDKMDSQNKSELRSFLTKYADAL